MAKTTDSGAATGADALGGARTLAGDGSLAELLARLRGLPLAEARALGRDRLPGSGSFEARAAALGARVAGALAALHAAGLVHGGVRPSAIRLDGVGALLAGAEPGERSPEASAYTAPERLGGAPPAPPGDVFALGATLYELLTLRPPFAGAGAAELARAVRACAPCPPRRAQPFLSTAAERVLLCALDPSPRLRPTADMLERDLQALAAGAPVAARPRSRWRRALGRLTRGG